MSLSSFVPGMGGDYGSETISYEEYEKLYGTATRDLIEIEVDGHILQPDETGQQRKAFEWYN